MGKSEAPLSHLTVLDLTDERGQLCGKILADLGARVIQVEPPRGSPSRRIGPFVGDDPDPEKGLFWLAMNTGKESLVLDLETGEGREALVRLAASADFLIESFAPGYLDELGLGHAELTRRNPRLVHVAITPFGQTGPYSGFAGPDLVCMALSGEMNLCGDPEDRPIRVSVPQAFFHASLEAAVGALFALEHRHRTGKGQFVDVSAQEAVIWEGSNNHILWYAKGVNIRREGSWRRFGPTGRMRVLFPCRDGHVVLYLVGGRVFSPGLRALVRWMDSEGRADDFLRSFDWEGFHGDGFDDRLAREIEARVGPFLAEKTKEELFERSLSDRFVVAPVCTARDVYEGHLLKERGFWSEVEHRELGRKVLYPGAPYKSSLDACTVRGPAPRLGDWKGPGPASESGRARAPGDSGGSSIFEGLKILDLSWAATGPAATRYFADYGARVVRIESTGQPDILRTAHPLVEGIEGLDRSAYFALYNSNKLGMTLDLKSAAGMDLAKRLVACADVVVESFSPGIIDKLGLGYDVVREIKPDIIMASTSQLGRDGPPFRGFGPQGAALAGVWSVTGYPGGGPTGLFGAYGDYVAYRYLAVAIAVALEEKRRTGLGQYIDQSQVESTLQFLAPALLDFAFNGRVARPEGNRDPSAAPHSAYRCRGEDRWCAIAVFTDDEWQALKQVMGRPAWADEGRFAALAARKANEDELDRLMDLWTSPQDARELMVRLQEAGVPAGLVAKAEDLHSDPQLAHRQHFAIVNHPVLGSYASDAAAFRLSAAPLGAPRPSPCLGEHNELVAKEILGLSHEEWVRLREAGAFG